MHTPCPCGLSWWSEANPLLLYCPLTPLLIHLSPSLTLWHAAARNRSITAVLTPVYESRPGTFKSKVTASEAFNLSLKGRAPPLAPTSHYLHPRPRPLRSHILDHPVPSRHLHYVWLCVCVRAHFIPDECLCRPHSTLYTSSSLCIID